ncbi:hypothetical protein CBR_g48386 [Chara braunii]|uniref:Pectate lyase domain-containing protein n=1 Tax=Chara braunii TaxID=69332 RepID=A0A388M2F6_CHABU|nr:hypothetical protein CBR_g48386 [Chara braunii]|eukprot:GBG88768.1 hypothetical protein CBR_g48386 [Chara braunii]
MLFFRLSIIWLFLLESTLQGGLLAAFPHKPRLTWRARRTRVHSTESYRAVHEHHLEERGWAWPGGFLPDREGLPLPLHHSNALPAPRLSGVPRNLIAIPEAFGYGREAAGGLAGRHIFVTSYADDGVGTLREACALSGPYYIHFQSNAILRLNSTIQCKSFKTVDGDGWTVQILGFGIDITGQESVVIKNIAFIRSKAEGIAIRNSRHIWVDHCVIQDAGKSAVLVEGMSRAITVSYCLMKENWEGLSLGGPNYFSGDKLMTVTVAFNVFVRSGSRTPLVRFGTCHLCNNVYDGAGRFSISALYGARLLVQNNYFTSNEQSQIGDGLADGSMTGDPAIIGWQGNLFDDGTPAHPPPLRANLAGSTLGIVTLTFACPRLPRHTIIRDAGPQRRS